MSIPPMILRGKVAEVHPRYEWPDELRRIAIHLDNGNIWLVPTECRFLKGERVTITIAVEEQNYGSKILEKIQSVGEEV